MTSASPSALPPLVPPLRFSLVEDGVHRGAYPSLINLRFLSRLGLRSMVSLLPEPPAPHLLRWCEENGVRNHFERVAPFREDVGLTHERAAELLQLLVLPERQPVYVHCLDGIGVTGTLIMCLRKLQRWGPPPLVSEYSRFFRDGLEVPLPPPPHVLAFLHAFKPDLELARLLPKRLPEWLAAALGLPTDTVRAEEEEQQAQQQAQQEQQQTHDAAQMPDSRGRSITVAGVGSSHDAESQRGDLGLNAASERSSALLPPALLLPRGGRERVSSSLDALAIEGLTMGRPPPVAGHAVTALNPLTPGAPATEGGASFGAPRAVPVVRHRSLR